MFVLPSIILGFIVSFPSLVYLYKLTFDDDMGVETKPVPDEFAVI